MKTKLQFLLTIMAMLLFTGVRSYSQTTLSPGDITVFHMQTDTTDEFKFITFVDLDPNTVIYFSSCGVNAGGIFELGNTNVNDGTFAYTVPGGGLSAGDIVTWILGAGSPNFSVYTDNISTRTTERNLATSGDQLIVFQKAGSPEGGVNALSSPSFIWATHLASTQFGGTPTDTNETNLPTGLSTTATPAVTALALGNGPTVDDEFDNAVYSGGYTFTSIAEARASFSNISNYTSAQAITEAAYVTAVNTIPIGGSITVMVSNTAPIATAPTTPTVTEDATNVALANTIQVTDADGDNQTVTFTVTGGTVALGTTGITFGGSGNGSASFTAAGTLAAINTALDAATFTPTAGLNGTNAGSISFTTFDGTIASSPASVTFNITPVNDVPSFIIGANQMVNEDAGAQTVTGFATDIEDGDPEVVQTVTFSAVAANTALFSVQPAISAAGNLTYTPAANAVGTTTITVSLSDDGGGTDTSADQTFDITLNAVNDVPSFTIGANQTVNEDVGAQMLTSFATAIEDGDPEVTQTVTFSAVAANTTLFSVQPAISAAGNLTYTPAANAVGTTTITVSLSDNGGGTDTSADQTFDITLNAVNDVPSFTIGANQTVNEDVGAQTVTGFATDIEDGDPEVTQAVAFNAVAANTALFSAEPAIDATGNLTYTPAANAVGTTTITVSLSDDGGGTDTSADQTFDITIAPINDIIPVITSITDDTGNNNTDFITRDNRPIINGTAKPGSTISFLFNGGDSFNTTGMGATTITNAMGQFSYEIPETLTVPFVGSVTVLPLPDGMASFSVVSRLNGIMPMTSEAVVVTVDTEAPTVVSIVRVVTPGVSPTNSDVLTWDVTFNEPIENCIPFSANFEITGATADVFDGTTMSPTVLRVQASGGTIANLNGTVTLAFKAGQVLTDVAGNSLTNTTPSGTNENTYVVDNAAPVVQSISLVGTPSAIETTVDYTVTFDENASNITTDDFELTLGGSAIGNIASVSAASGTSVTVTIDGISGSNMGAIRLDLKASTDIIDDLGNANVVAFTTGEVHNVDFTALSIDENEAKINITFINPVSETLEILGTSVEAIEIYNLSGSLVSSSTTNIANVTSLSTGIYFAKIVSNGSVITKKIVKK